MNLSRLEGIGKDSSLAADRADGGEVMRLLFHRARGDAAGKVEGNCSRSTRRDFRSSLVSKASGAGKLRFPAPRQVRIRRLRVRDHLDLEDEVGVRRNVPLPR